MEINQQEFESLKRQVTMLSDKLDDLRKQTNNPRVVIDNFEGVLKILPAVPTTTQGFRDGSVVLTDVGGTRKIYVYITGAWYSVTVT